MAMNASEVERIKFGGALIGVAEDEFNASISGEGGVAFKEHLYQEYLSEGKPKNVKAWARTKFKSYFMWMAQPPDWFGADPEWPYLNGRPMVFITQFKTLSNSICKEHLASDTLIYIFGARVAAGELWKMEYRVVAFPQSFCKTVMFVDEFGNMLGLGNKKQ